MKHTKRCEFSRTGRALMVHRKVPNLLTGETLACDHLECATCGTWLPIGFSNETAVMIEVRAVEIWKYVNFTVMDADRAAAWACDPAELNGWLAHRNGLFPGIDDEYAGYLARVIWEHDGDMSCRS